MSFGEHLEELRSRLIKALLGIAAGFVLGIFLAKPAIMYISQPLVAALETAGHEPQMINISPAENFVTFFKVALYIAVVISAPWVFHQLWTFAAAGLYKHEKRFINIFAPFSAILFMTGACFFINVVAPISFNFFVNFSDKWFAPDYSDKFLYDRIFNKSQEDTPAAEEDTPPQLPEKFTINWVYLPPLIFGGQVQITLPDEAPAAPEKKQKDTRLIRPSYSFNEVVSWIAWLSLVFGLAFQIPLVVLTLGKLRLVKLKTFKTVRKYLILVFFVLSAIITPPDVFSQIALALPMYALYELGLTLLQYWPKNEGEKA